jgi:hypothetical protein
MWTKASITWVRVPVSNKRHVYVSLAHIVRVEPIFNTDQTTFAQVEADECYLHLEDQVRMRVEISASKFMEEVTS